MSHDIAEHYVFFYLIQCYHGNNTRILALHLGTSILSVMVPSNVCITPPPVYPQDPQIEGRGAEPLSERNANMLTVPVSHKL
jgi:hypothetical protein